jgi:hypothetical protein
MLKRLFPMFIPLYLLVLAGCGGGASDSAGTLTLAVSNASITADGTVGTATATYTPPSGRPQMSGTSVSFRTEPAGLISLSSSSDSTNSSGVAKVTYSTFATVASNTVVRIFANTGGLESDPVIITLTPLPSGVTPPTPPVIVAGTPNSIAFSSAQPSVITLKGMGGAGLQETSNVSFIVRDTANKALANQTVDFALNTTVGGITLSSASAVSDSNGLVQTIVSSGIVATPVRVTASVRGTNISVQSDQLVVSTGIPDQVHFSISVSEHNSESYNHDGVQVDVTALLADHFANPVPDGTAISFTTSGGSIQPACTTVGGACTVKWTSQNPRPTSPAGRPVIFAYAVGEESFIDANGNGLADAGTCTPVTIPGVGTGQQCGEFVDSPEAFRDDDYDGVKDASEPYIDFNNDGVYNGPDSLFNGVLRPTSVAATVAKTKHVFSNTQIVMSTDAAIVTVSPTSFTVPGTTFNVTVTDLNGNTMAKGTTISITVPFGVATGATSFTVPDNIGYGYTLPVVIAAAETPKAQSGMITISVKSPGGLETLKYVPISGNF